MFNTRSVLIICYMLPWLSLYSQQIDNTFLTAWQAEVAKYPQECIYIQTSKDLYETGEDLWFKTYLLDAQTFGLSEKSKTLYLQMINEGDSVVWQEKYPIDSGIVSGHAYLGEELKEGDYYLEGYTKYSFFDNDTLSILPSRRVKIVKNVSYSEKKQITKDSEFRFEMFPEGGDLVVGIYSNLAFKATDSKGNPVNVEGKVFQDGEILCLLKTVHNGMGKISFMPLQGKNYHVELENGNSYSLPVINSEGMAIRLSKQSKEQLEFVVSQSENHPKRQFYLLGQMRGMICCMAKGILKDTQKITIPLNNFNYQGIAEFTLFNETMQPVAERLVYVHPTKKLYIMAEPEKKTFTTREKGTVKIKVTDENGVPVKANLGITIYDQAYNAAVDLKNIMTSCYISSQIRGKIYNPYYYFDEKNSRRVEAMDMLLLTQGWRRYVWSSKISDFEGRPILTDEITGFQSTKNMRKNKFVSNSEQLLQVSGPEGNSNFVWVDSTGSFSIGTDMMRELQGGYVYLKPMMSKESKPELRVDNQFSTIGIVRNSKTNFYPYTDFVDERKEFALMQAIVSQDSTILLDEITITGKGKKPFRDKFMGRLDSLTKLDINGPYVCGCGYLQNYMSDYDAHPIWKPCSSAKKVSKPVEGKTYEIVKFKHLAGDAFEVLDRKTIVYHGPMYSEEELLRMNNLWRIKGYYSIREFYQPDEIDIQSSMPDARNTLLWNPSVITDENGEATVSFYCSDVNTGFIGVIEGVDGFGLLGTTKCEFRVIKNPIP